MSEQQGVPQTVDEFLQSLRQEVQGLRRDFEVQHQAQVEVQRRQDAQLSALEAQLQHVQALQQQLLQQQLLQQQLLQQQAPSTPPTVRKPQQRPQGPQGGKKAKKANNNTKSYRSQKRKSHRKKSYKRGRRINYLIK